MQFRTLISAAVFAVLLIGCSSSGINVGANLPEEGRRALEDKIREYEYLNSENAEASLVSATQGNDWNGETLWCVKMDRPVRIGPAAYSQHIFVLKSGNLWQTIVSSSERNWLYQGCDNWSEAVNTAPEVSEPTTQIYPTALSPADYDVEIDFVSLDKINGTYFLTYNVTNNAAIEVQVCVTAFGRGENPDHYNDTRVISSIGGEHGSCALTLAPTSETIVEIDTKDPVEENDAEEFKQICGQVWTYHEHANFNKGFDKLAEWKSNDDLECR